MGTGLAQDGTGVRGGEGAGAQALSGESPLSQPQEGAEGGQPARALSCLLSTEAPGR